jgi:hypothetical protein
MDKDVYYILSSSTALIAVILTLYNFKYMLQRNQYQEVMKLKEVKRDRAFQIYQRWTSPEMLKWRHIVGPYLISINGKVNWSSISEDSSSLELYENFGPLIHFFADLSTLIKEGLLDDELLKKLMGATIDFFIKNIITRIEYDLPRDQKWYDENLRPLEGWCSST